jgi:hypothetical protein
MYLCVYVYVYVCVWVKDFANRSLLINGTDLGILLYLTLLSYSSYYIPILYLSPIYSNYPYLFSIYSLFILY